MLETLGFKRVFTFSRSTTAAATAAATWWRFALALAVGVEEVDYRQSITRRAEAVGIHIEEAIDTRIMFRRKLSIELCKRIDVIDDRQRVIGSDVVARIAIDVVRIDVIMKPIKRP